MSEREITEDRLAQAVVDGEITFEWHALIERLAAERDEARAKADDNILFREHRAACGVIPPHHLLDPPDGGDVKLHEGITRYAAAEYARGKAEAQALLAEVAGALEPFARDAERARDLSPNNSIGHVTKCRARDLRTARAVRDKIKGVGDAQPKQK